MLKKWITMALACSMVFSLLTGCDSTKNSAGTTTTSTSKNQTQSQKTSEPIVKIPNFNGATIKIMTAGGNLAPTGGTELGDLNVKWYEDVQKKYNVKLEIIKEANDIIQKVTAANMANDKIADFLYMPTGQTFTAAIQGLIQPWDGKIDLKNPMLRSNVYKDMAPAMMYNGKLYQMAISTAGSLITSGDVLYFNKTIFKKYGIEMPYDLVRKNQWNWENFRKIAKKATIDTNNDGQIDIWGVANLGHADRTLGFFFSNKASIANINANGKVEPKIGDPAYIETLEFFRQLAQVDKSMEPKDKAPGYDDCAKQLKAGKVAMTPYIRLSKAMKEGFTDEFGIVPFPMGPNVKNYTGGTMTMYGYALPNSVDKIEDKSIVLIDWLANNPYVTEEKVNKLRYDEWAQYCYDIDSVDMLKLMDKIDMMFDFGALINKAPGFYDVSYNVLSGKKTSATAVEELKPVYQAEIDKIFPNSK